MNTYTTRYLANTKDGKQWIDITIDLTPFLDDGLNEYAAQEQALEIFERNCINFIEW